MAKNLQTVARRALTPCAGEDAFRFADGSLCRDLTDLRQAVETKSSYLLAHHRDHYHDWVAEILGDPALARKLQRLAGRRNLDNEVFRDEMRLILDERIGKLRARVV